MANKSINTLDNTSTLDNADLLVLWKSSANAAYNISGQDFVTMLTALASGHGGISNIAYTAPVAPSLDGTLTITLADGTSSSFTVSNGAQGPQGDQTYVWIAYSAVNPTSDADVSVIPGPWIGFYAGLESTQANLHYTDYTWYEFKGPAGDGVAYTAQTGTVGLTRTYTMYTADGTAVGSFSVTDGSGAVSTVNGIAPDGDGDVPAIVASVTDLGLTSGSATIADAYVALQANQLLICPATDFAVGELPLTGGSRQTEGAIEIQKSDASTNGWIRFLGKTSTVGDYRMFLDNNGDPTGTWVRDDLAVESGTVSPKSGITMSSGYLKRSGNVAYLVVQFTGVDIPTSSLTTIATINKFIPSESVVTTGLVGFGSTCYLDVSATGDIRVRGASAQTNVAVRASLTWILD